MASAHQKEEQLSINQEFHDVKSFAKLSYQLLTAYSPLPHPALGGNVDSKVALNPQHNEHLSVVKSNSLPVQPKCQAASHKGHKEREKSSLLRDYLLQLAERKATILVTEEGEAIRSMMENAAEHFCEYLSQNFCLFKDCRLLKTGSVYEDVKIGKPDEFDFMIEVPQLASGDAIAFQRSLLASCNGRIGYEVQSKAPFMDIFEFRATQFTVIGPVEQEAFMRCIFCKLCHVIESEFTKFLPDGWEFMGISGQSNINAEMLGMSGIDAPARMALTPCFLWHGKTFQNLKVTVDFSIAIPIIRPARKDEEKQNFNELSEENHLPNSVPGYAVSMCEPSLSETCDSTKPETINNKVTTAACNLEDNLKEKISLFCKHVPQDHDESDVAPLAQEKRSVSVRHTIPDVFHLLLADFIWCRASFSIQEQNLMKQFDVSGSQKICMRLVKYLRNVFIAQEYDDKTFDLKPIISTYWLKTIMYYMFKKYSDAETAWNPANVHDRVLEVFETLLECLQQGSLHNFFIPNYNLLWMKQPGELKAAVNEVTSLMNLLYSLESGQSNLDNLEEKECRQLKKNEQILYEKRKSVLLAMLLEYAIYGSDPDSVDEELLQRINCFARNYLDGVAGHAVQIVGDGQDISFLEDGESVNIGIKETIAFLNETA